jgi:DNA-binding NtrC family response regulator
MTNTPTILYVDDEVDNLTSFKANFRRDFTIFTAENALEGLELFRKQDIEVVLTDQKMPGMSGVEFLREVVKLKPEIPRIIITAYSDINVVIEGVNDTNIFKFIQKPWNVDYLRTSIFQAHELLFLRRENARLIEELKTANSQLEFYLRQKLLS